MKYLIYTVFLLGVLACNDRKPVRVLPQFGKPAGAAKDDFEFSPATAHPNAKNLMKEEFFWSSIERASPFGNDDGSDAAYSFRQWRAHDKSGSAVTFLREMLNSWNYPYFDWNELDSTKIKDHIDSASGDTSFKALLWQDNAIIGTAFAQFVLEGKTDRELQKFATTAIERQLLPVLINRYDEPYREKRFQQLRKMLEVVRQMNKQ